MSGYSVCRLILLSSYINLCFLAVQNGFWVQRWFFGFIFEFISIISHCSSRMLLVVPLLILMMCKATYFQNYLVSEFLNNYSTYWSFKSSIGPYDFCDVENAEEIVKSSLKTKQVCFQNNSRNQTLTRHLVIKMSCFHEALVIRIVKMGYSHMIQS